MALTEANFQARLIRQYRAEGYLVVKIIRANINGLPDLLLLKDGQARWVEVKAAGGRVAPLQALRHKQLQNAGFDVEVRRAPNCS